MDETPAEVFVHLRRAWGIFSSGKKERTHTLMAGLYLFMPWLFLQLACSKDELFTWICTQPVELSFIIMGNINAQLSHWSAEPGLEGEEAAEKQEQEGGRFAQQ